MKNIEKIKDNIILFSFSSFLFLWSFKVFDHLDFRLMIILPMILMFFNFRKLFFNKNYIKFYIFFLIFIIYFFFSNIIYYEDINFTQVLKLLFLITLFFCYLNNRNLLEANFRFIFYFFSIVLLLSSILISPDIDIGSCNYVFIKLLDKININLSTGIFQERSHLAMMNIAILVSGFYFFLTSKNYYSFIFLILLLIINLINVSTTFILGFILSSLLIILIIKNRIFSIFLIFMVFFLTIFFQFNKNCSKKITDLSFSNIYNKDLSKRKNLTSTVYERSIIVMIDTLKNKPLGWGFDNYSQAVLKFNRTHNNQLWDNLVFNINTKDGAGNIFKVFTEFGYITFFFLFIFIKYLILIKKKIIKTSPFKIFLICLFLTQLFRGAGYLNGGFILAFYEFLILFYNKKLFFK